MSKLEVSSGCTSFWSRYQGKDLEQLSISELEEAWEYLCNTIKATKFDEDTLKNNIKYLTEDFGSTTYEDEEPCEQCGDFIIVKEL